ncbi:MAG: D-2-hydroxyacid dehydrogenase [Muribaculaceae bacterium]|nr:D-2-hydroxyacid dehydrogenase [Muribaculaceae bacterium]
MNIVVLDAYSVNPGDLSWEGLEALGNVTLYDRTPRELIIERAADAEIILTNKVPMDRETINALPKLKYIGVLATGFNIVDLAVASQRGIVVTNIPSYSTDSVAQMVFALLLAITNRVEHYTQEVHEGHWCKSLDFCYWNTPLPELAGKNFGIYGFGHIGQAVARIALAFGMKVITATSKSPDKLPQGVEKVSLDQLFELSDVLSLHCPLNDDTRGMVNAGRLSMMKPSAILINTSRGPVIDEDALAKALRDGTIAAAGLDVLSTEPPCSKNPLIGAPNCFITPHLAWASLEARQRLVKIATDNVAQFLHNTPVNVVN